MAIFQEDSQPQQQNSVQLDPLPVGVPLHSDFFKHLINSDDELFTYRLYLEGKAVVTNPETGEDEFAQDGEPMLNSIGVHDTMTALSSICKRGTYVSNLDEATLHIDLLAVTNSYWTMLMKNSVGENRWNTKKENWDMLREMFFTFAEYAMRRPLDQGEREVFRGNKMQSEQTIRQYTQDAPRKKIFGLF